MTQDFGYDFGTDAPPPQRDAADSPIIDVPHHLETGPDGQEILVLGDVEHCRDFCQKQGDNDLGFRSDCGLCSSKDVLNQFGINVSENDIVHYASDNSLCNTRNSDNGHNGGTYEWQQAQILSDHGVPAHVEAGDTQENLEQYVAEGRGVIIEVNAGVLWDRAEYWDNGAANHAITVTGIAADPLTGAVLGYYVNDSGAGQAGHYVDAQTMDSMWVQSGGSCVVSDVVK